MNEAAASLKSSDARICKRTVPYLLPDNATDFMLAGIDSVSTALNVGKWKTHNKGLQMKKKGCVARQQRDVLSHVLC